MNRVLRVALAFALGALVAGAACAAPPTPMLWKVGQGESTVYLLGSMHALESGDYPLSADVEAAYRSADRLVFELPPADLQSPATLALTLKHGMQQDPAHTLRDDLSPALWAKVVAYGAKNGLPEAVLLKFEPWLAAITMVALESRKLGMDPQAGLDMHFMHQADIDHKRTAGLETADQQLSIFYAAPMRVQDDLLQQTLDELADFPKEMAEEHANWRRGDTVALLANTKKDFDRFPDLYRQLIVQRNRNWIPQIEKMLDGGRHVTLVIVGALHLPGKDGVVHLLRQDGYTVERVCTGCKNLR